MPSLADRLWDVAGEVFQRAQDVTETLSRTAAQGAQAAGQAFEAASGYVAERRSPSPAWTPARSDPAPDVLPNRTGFVQGVPRGGFGEDDALSQTGTSDLSRPDFLQELWEVYLKCPWAWASVNAIARTVTAGGLVMKWDSDDGKFGQKQPPKPREVVAFERLLAFCNPTQDIRQLSRNIVADLQVFGGAMVEVVWFAGIPVALYNQDFPTTTPETDEHGAIIRYVQRTEDDRKATFKPEQIIYISLDSARPAVFGISPTHAVEESIVAWMYLHSCMKEGARRGLPPNVHADLPAGTPDTDAQRWQQQYASRNIGPSNQGTPITTKGGGKVTEIQKTRLPDILQAKKDARDEIVAGYGVPPAKVGIIEAGNLGGGTGSDQNRALDLMTMIPTPTGWTTMGELKPGDQVLDEAGRPCNVVSTHEVPDASSWRIHFSDGTHIDACLDHLWVTWTADERKAYGRALTTVDTTALPENWPQWRTRRGTGPQIRRTEEILGTFTDRRGKPNHSIPVTGALQLPEADLPLDPYTLGAWLGDGTSAQASIACAPGEEQILDEIRSAGFTVRERPSQRKSGKCPSYGINGGFLAKLREMGLLQNKHIPAQYLRASAEQRLALLQGLMDTDGGWAARPQCVFVSTKEHLANAVLELARSLGQKAVLAKRRSQSGPNTRRIDVGPQFRVTWTPTVQPFRLRRKAERFDRSNAQGMRVRHRTIVGAEKIADRPMRCIKVDSPNEMYLAGEGMIPTHNTYMLDIIQPVAMLIAEKLQFHLAVKAFGIKGWHCEFPTTDYRDEKIIEDIRDQRLRNGSWTLNRYRAEIGEPPVDGGDDAVLIARQDIVLWSDLADLSASNVASGADVLGGGKPGPPPAAGTQPSKGPGGSPSPVGGLPAEAVIAAQVADRLVRAGVLEHTAKLTTRQRAYNQLARSFPASALTWVNDDAVQWSGPVRIAPSDVDTSDKAEWDAVADKAKVAQIKRRYRRAGKMKPIVVVRAPGADKDVIADGHHHYLAAVQLGIPVRAYVAHVAKKKGPWNTLSLRQKRTAESAAYRPLTKDEADYAPATSPDMRCGTCVMFHDDRCDLVAGDIDAGFVCSQWLATGSESRRPRRRAVTEGGGGPDCAHCRRGTCERCDDPGGDCGCCGTPADDRDDDAGQVA